MQVGAFAEASLAASTRRFENLDDRTLLREKTERLLKVSPVASSSVYFLPEMNERKRNRSIDPTCRCSILPTETNNYQRQRLSASETRTSSTQKRSWHGSWVKERRKERGSDNGGVSCKSN